MVDGGLVPALFNCHKADSILRVYSVRIIEVHALPASVAVNNIRVYSVRIIEVHTLPDSVAVNNIRVYSVRIIEVHSLPASVAVMVDGGLVPALLTAPVG